MDNPTLLLAEWWIRWLNRLKNLSAFLVALGVAGEFLGDWLLAPYQKVVDDNRDQQIAMSNERANASELELAKIKLPRKLSSEQQSVLASNVAEFAGTRFDMAVIANDPEALAFVGQIAGPLRTAGWEWIEWNHPTGPFMNVYSVPGLPNIGQETGEGIDIQFDRAGFSHFAKAAQALASALAVVGFQARVSEASRSDIPNRDTIHVLIGKKVL